MVDGQTPEHPPEYVEITSLQNLAQQNDAAKKVTYIKRTLLCASQPVICSRAFVSLVMAQITKCEHSNILLMTSVRVLENMQKMTVNCHNKCA